MSSWISFTVVVFLPVILRLPKVLSPLRMSRSDPVRFAGAFRRHYVNAFTGRASDASKGQHALVTGSVGSSMAPGGGISSVQGRIDTEVVISDHFVLTDTATGVVQGFNVTGFNVAIGEGHMVSVAQVMHGRAKKGRIFLVYNHTTRQTFINDESIYRGLTAPYPRWYIALMILTILGIPAVAVVGLLSWGQAVLFKRSGIKPLLRALEATADQMPAPEPETVRGVTSSGIAYELTQLSDLHDSGRLSDAEYEASKSKLLGAAD